MKWDHCSVAGDAKDVIVMHLFLLLRFDGVCGCRGTPLSATGSSGCVDSGQECQSREIGTDSDVLSVLLTI